MSPPDPHETAPRPKACDQGMTMKLLRKIHLGVHALVWIDYYERGPKPGGADRPERAEWEQSPQRYEASYRHEVGLQEKYRDLIRNAGEDEGIFLLTTGLPANGRLTALAKEHFGPRCVVCRLIDPDHEWSRDLPAPSEPEGYLRGLDEAQREEFVRSLEEDRRMAVANRGLAEHELNRGEMDIWVQAKRWAMDMTEQLRQRGYGFDPASVQFEAFGEEWASCAAVYPIYLGRAFGLAAPIERRFDMIHADAGPLLTELTAVEQNLPLAGNIRLFIYRTRDSRYVAEFWEGVHGIMDSPRRVLVDFPPESTAEVNLWGMSIDRAAGIPTRYGGRIEMCVGCGCQTSHKCTLVMARGDTSLEAFRSALLNGTVVVTRPA